jgi:mono/diheme cytochrome c family protein
VLILLSAPFVSKRFSPKVVQGAFFGILGFFVVAGILFGGGFAPLIGNRDPVAVKAVTPGPTSAVDQALYAKGRELFKSNGCNDCHGTDGRAGTSGPSLLGIAARRGTDPAWYMKFIHNPTSVKPNSMMPAFGNLKDDETRAIAEFLIHQK